MSLNHDGQYLHMLNRTITYGYDVDDKLVLYGAQMTVNLNDNKIPILTSRYICWSDAVSRTLAKLKVSGEKTRRWSGETCDFNKVVDKLRANPTFSSVFVKKYNMHIQLVNSMLLAHVTCHFIDLVKEFPFVMVDMSILVHAIGTLVGACVSSITFSISTGYVQKFHVEEAKEQVSNNFFPTPKLKIINRSQRKTIDYKSADFILLDYKATKAFIYP